MAHTLPLVAPVPTAALEVGPTDPLVGTKLNGFVITGTVSVGGMGVVYEARHPLIGRRAAVKVIRPELCDDLGLSARFLREAQAVSAIKHQHVVEILDFGALPDGAQYMMMEFLEGDTLAQVIARDAPMQPREALRICEEILSGLSAAHQAGVVHRDLKPANIVLLKQSSGELIVKVLDFGLARQLDTAPEPTTRESLREMSLEKSSLLAGTPEYISPEQASGEQVGAQGDLYCLGVILYEMLSGRLPFNSTSPWELMQQHRLEQPPPLNVITAGLDPRLEDFVMRLLKKDPADRPLGAKEAARELTELKAALGLGTPSGPLLLVDRVEARGPRRFWSARRAAAAGASLAVGLLALGLSFASASAPTLEASPRLAPAPQVFAVPLPLPPPTWERPLPEPTVVATLPRLAARSRARPSASSSCQSNHSWKRAIREQLEDLEQLSLAKMEDDAPPSEVAKIRERARLIAASVKKAKGLQCQQVEADLRAWRTALR